MSKHSDFLALLQNSDAEAGKAIFNSGLLKLQRIDKLKMAMHAGRIEQDFDLIITCLMGIHSELLNFMSDAERKSGAGLEVAAYNEIVNNTKKVCRYGGEVTRDYSRVKLEPILKFERFLSDIEHKSGLGMPVKGSKGDAISDME